MISNGSLALHEQRGPLLHGDALLRTTEFRQLRTRSGTRLQQLYVDFDGEHEEWRDVPLVFDLPPRLVARSVGMRLAEPDDAAFILSLRTDPAKNRYLSPTANDVAAQRRWLEAYKRREQAGREFYFVIETLKHEPCGVVRVYDIEHRAFTWGSWIVGDNAPRKTAIESALLVYVFAFDELGLSECRFDVRLGNERTLAFHDRFGATRTHRDELNQYYVYPRRRWEIDRPRYAEFLTDGC